MPPNAPVAVPEPDSPSSLVEIIDIRKTARSNTTANLTQLIVQSLENKTVPFYSPKFVNDFNNNTLLRSIPTLVLYDDRGLEIFDQITYIDEYYLTNAEIDIFKRYGRQM
ncbi:hypothetical protein HK102_007170, partial [Quaeritorhiza haematococci]